MVLGHSHYRKDTGDLILDRVLRVIPNPRATFRTISAYALTGQNIDAHIARSRARLADWVAANPDLAAQIIAAPRKVRKREPASRGHLLVGSFSS